MATNRRREWHQIQPGVYDDNRGGLHIVMSEFFAGHGYRDSSENRATLLAVIRQMFPGSTVEHEEEP